jgi:hypothetical protein
MMDDGPLPFDEPAAFLSKPPCDGEPVFRHVDYSASINGTWRR